MNYLYLYLVPSQLFVNLLLELDCGGFSCPNSAHLQAPGKDDDTMSGYQESNSHELGTYKANHLDRKEASYMHKLSLLIRSQSPISPHMLFEIETIKFRQISQSIRILASLSSAQRSWGR